MDAPMKIKIKKAELKYGLKVPKRLYTYDDSTLALIVNGCGPEDEPVVGPFGVVPGSFIK